MVSFTTSWGRATGRLSTLVGERCRLVSPGFRLASCISRPPNLRHSNYTFSRAFTVSRRTSDEANKSSAIARRLKDPEHAGQRARLREFGLDNRVYVVTGGARGLGLVLAEALVEAGGHVYCLDRLTEPDASFHETQRRLLASGFDGSLHYKRVDVQDAKDLDWVISEAAAAHGRMDGLVAAAGVQNVTPALEYPPEKIAEMMNINYTGVYLSAVACAKQMIKYKTPGAMCLIGSMSGLVANKGLITSVYNSSKAAVMQLGRSLAMEWGQMKEFEGVTDASVAGSHLGHKRGIRVNVLCPGNIITPMVQKNFEDEPHLRALWESGNMMGRISEPEEYRGAVLFMLSDASSFMTGSHLVVDGGYTAW
ncbi:hypothetical protein LTR70_006170 [Exophiala xenobiotica]|uniref:Uncharacterized protein n=1 Tax=Lithohypha guttulata TaxID=1690604 RepID=A0ABR0K7T7_9EURO|nr:hypothetical protein LTR24_005848 [Lithohypha guttulata]KAK5316621.1 hypothetical protein LTR70_006170 [Exophiala xenobiotica]